MRMYLFCMLFLLSCVQLHAQQKYWIYLNEKNPDIKNSDADARLDHLRTHGIEPVLYSSWLRAASGYLPESYSTMQNSDSCILSIEAMHHVVQPAGLQSASDDVRFDAVLKQINGNVLTEAGYTGKGVLVGVIDAGFLNADRNRFLKNLIENEQIKAFRNFIETGDKERFSKDYHGTQVLTHLAGSRNDHSQVHGLAYDATFYLARTDQDDLEYRGEEDYWVAALEWMHSKGVRLVNSSLGYSDGYDNPRENYEPEQADGKSTAIARAASIAVKEKGMLLIISAGNEGNRRFRVLSIPGDAEGVLTVGATSLRWPWTKMGYSSVGTPGLSYVKPDVSCYSFNGTSYSAPVITGLAAAVWQARPDLTNTQVAEWIRSSSHLASSPNNYLGYGVPDGIRLLEMIDNRPVNSVKSRIIRSKGPSVTLPSSGWDLVIYQKDSEWNVIDEEVIPASESELTITRPEKITHTTVVTPLLITEIIWED